MAEGRIRIGDMTRRITLQFPRSVPTDSGDQTVTWVDKATVWARKRPITGRERYASEQVQGVAEVEYVIWNRADVIETWRVVDGDSTYEITRPPYDPDPDGNGRWLVLECGTAAE